MNKAKRWIVSAGACLLALTGLNVSFGQIPTAPIPEKNNDGLPQLTEPAPFVVEPLSPIEEPVAPEPQVNVNQQKAEPAPIPQQAAAPQQTVAPQQAAVPQQTQQTVAPQQAAVPQQAAPVIINRQPCQQCLGPCQQCPPGALYTPNPYYGQDSRPWWLNIRPVPYVPVESGDVAGFGGFGGGPMAGGFGPRGGCPMGCGDPGCCGPHGCRGLGAHGLPAHAPHRVPIEPPFYTVRGPRDFYLDNPRPLGY